jgi:hypothetical protein
MDTSSSSKIREEREELFIRDRLRPLQDKLNDPTKCFTHEYSLIKHHGEVASQYEDSMKMVEQLKRKTESDRLIDRAMKGLNLNRVETLEKVKIPELVSELNRMPEAYAQAAVETDRLRAKMLKENVDNSVAHLQRERNAEIYNTKLQATISENGLDPGKIKDIREAQRILEKSDFKEKATESISIIDNILADPKLNWMDRSRLEAQKQDFQHIMQSEKTPTELSNQFYRQDLERCVREGLPHERFQPRSIWHNTWSSPCDTMADRFNGEGPSGSYSCNTTREKCGRALFNTGSVIKDKITNKDDIFEGRRDHL